MSSGLQRQRQLTGQSIGLCWFYTECTLIQALVLCVSQLRDTRVYLSLLPAVLVPPLVITAILNRERWFPLGFWWLVLTILGNITYLTVLLVLHIPSSTDPNVQFAFYILVGTVIFHAVIGSWIAVLLFWISPTQTSPILDSRRLSPTVLGLALAYALSVGLSYLLNFTDVLDWSSFNLALLLPTGVPIVLVNVLLKSVREIALSQFMVWFCEAVELVWLIWVFTNYRWQEKPAELWPFWFLFVLILSRLALTIVWTVLACRQQRVIQPEKND